MPYQFACPQGHSLQAEPYQVGQWSSCPICGSQFQIPAPVATPAGPVTAYPASGYSTTPPPLPGSPPGNQPPPAPPYSPAGAFPPPTPPAELAAGAPGLPESLQGIVSETPSSEGPAEHPPEEEELLHIPCPNGHVLETPLDMLDQEVLCPTCKTQFRLRRRDSEEAKRQKEQQQLRRERRVEKAWFNFAVVTAVVVALGVATLAFLSFAG